MTHKEERELLTKVMTNFLEHYGIIIDELEEAIQDCGFSDREMMDMCNEAYDTVNASIDKS
jgi:hypothetical protein